jgi:hypothetical protein
VQAGVRSIEHGNLIDEATARVMKTHGTYLVPTLATYAALADEGVAWAGRRPCWTSWKGANRGVEAVRIARPRACRWSSAPTCWATCTTGRTASSRCARPPVSPVLELLQSATLDMRPG